MTSLVPLRTLSRNVDLFDRFVADAFGDLSGRTNVRGGYGLFALDLKETDDSYVVSAELPGFTAENIDLSLENGLLTIKAHKDAEEKKDGEHYHFSERSYGEFLRTIRLPKNIAGDADAHYDNGVLTVTLAKAEEAKPRKIAIS